MHGNSFRKLTIRNAHRQSEMRNNLSLHMSEKYFVQSNEQMSQRGRVSKLTHGSVEFSRPLFVLSQACMNVNFIYLFILMFIVV